jgi:hypothetical protein
MQDLSPATLLVLVPLLPLVGAILTVLLGRVLGGRAHLPATNHPWMSVRPDLRFRHADQYGTA